MMTSGESVATLIVRKGVLGAMAGMGEVQLSRAAVQCHKTLAALFIGAALLGAGCSRPAAEDASSDAQTVSPAAADTAPTQAATPTAPAAAEAETPPTISGIPLDVWPDVWFEDPLAVAGDRVAVSTATPQATAGEQPRPVAESSSPAEAPAAAADPNQPAWQGLLSADDIQNEVKEIRLTLKQAFQSVQRYNGHYKELQVDGSVLAALAAVAQTHDDRITWKSKSPSVRDLAAKLTAASAGLGRTHYDPALRLYEQIDQLLSGNMPADLPAPNTEARLDEFAPRGKLMKRMQRADDWLKANTGTEGDLQSESEQARHEALMIALLATVTAEKKYDMAGEPEYRTQAEALIAASRAAAAAAQNNDFAAFSAAREKMTKACTACHLDFRFDEE